MNKQAEELIGESQELIACTEQLQEQIRKEYQAIGKDPWILELGGEDFEKVFTDRFVACCVYDFYHKRDNKQLTKDGAYEIAEFVKVRFEIACRITAKEQKKSPFSIAHYPILEAIIEGIEDQVEER